MSLFGEFINGVCPPHRQGLLPRHGLSSQVPQGELDCLSFVRKP
jgi:hypothetical protein